jgi:hypothetical protein
MFGNRFFTRSLFVSLMMAGLLSSAHAADPCQPLANAAGKLATTPTHIYGTTINNATDNKPTTTEMIYAKGAVYLKVGGNWMRTKLTPQELVTQDQDKRKNGSCQYLKDESIDGEAAAVYSERSQSGEAQAQLWISKSSGLLLHMDWDIGSSGQGHTTHISMRYEYANVQPPKI